MIETLLQAILQQIDQPKKDLENCEKKIATTEHAISVIESKMFSMADFSGNEYKQLFAEHQKLKNELMALMTNWEDLASTID